MLPWLNGHIWVSQFECWKERKKERKEPEQITHQEDWADETSADREEQPHVHNSWSSEETSTAAGHKQSKRFLESSDDNFCLQVIEEPRRRGTLWALFSPAKRGWWGMWSPRAALAAQTINGGVWGPQDSEEGAQQAHYPWLYPSLWSFQAPAWQSPRG